MGFKISSIMNNQTLAQAKDTHRVVYLSRNSILPNPSNEHLYSTDNVKLLSLLIEDKGLLEPLIVRRLGSDSSGNSTYELLSGHRRLLAIKQLVLRSPDKAAEFENIPCIVRESSSPDDDLIDGNLGNRNKTKAEIAKELEKKKELMEKRKANGDAIAGRIISLIADEMNISEHQAKKLNSINMKGSEDTIKAFNEGKLSTDAAYALSRVGQDEQEEIIDSLEKNGEKLTAKKIKETIKKKNTRDESDDNLPDNDSSDISSTVTFAAQNDSIESDALTEASDSVLSAQTSAEAALSSPEPGISDKINATSPDVVTDKLSVVSGLVGMIRKFRSSDDSVTFNSEEISAAINTLSAAYNRLVRQG